MKWWIDTATMIKYTKISMIAGINDFFQTQKRTSQEPDGVYYLYEVIIPTTSYTLAGQLSYPQSSLSQLMKKL